MNEEHTYISRSPAETESLGESWGRQAQPGWVIGLTGDLGAGKTQLVKGIARGLGFPGKVQSPTFALINEYTGGRVNIFHIDLYRLETRPQIIRAGLEQYFYNPAGVSVIEWIERWTGDAINFQLPIADRGDARNPRQTTFRMARIENLSETERRITYEDFGR